MPLHIEQSAGAFRIFITLIIMEILCYDYIIIREINIYRQIPVAAEIEER
jgi:hypothetical protein